MARTIFIRLSRVDDLGEVVEIVDVNPSHISHRGSGPRAHGGGLFTRLSFSNGSTLLVAEHSDQIDDLIRSAEGIEPGVGHFDDPVANILGHE